MGEPPFDVRDVINVSSRFFTDCAESVVLSLLGLRKREVARCCSVPRGVDRCVTLLRMSATIGQEPGGAHN